MKHKRLKKISFKHWLFVFVRVFVVSFMLGNDCSTNTKLEDPTSLANTTWRLDYIQAEEGNVFPNHERSRWEPSEMGDYAYYLEFIGEDSVTTAPFNFELRNTCTLVSGNYKIIPQDSIKISWTKGRIPRGPHCSRYEEFPEMVASVETYLKQQDILLLHVKGFVAAQPSEKSWAKSILSFSRVTKNEN